MMLLLRTGGIELMRSSMDSCRGTNSHYPRGLDTLIALPPIWLQPCCLLRPNIGQWLVREGSLSCRTSFLGSRSFRLCVFVTKRCVRVCNFAILWVCGFCGYVLLQNDVLLMKLGWLAMCFFKKSCSSFFQVQTDFSMI